MKIDETGRLTGVPDENRTITSMGLIRPLI